MSVVMISSTSSLIMSVVMIPPWLEVASAKRIVCVVAKVNQPALSLGTERWLIHNRFHCICREVSLAPLARPRHWERPAPEHWRGTTGSRTSRLCLPGTTDHWNAVAPESHDLIEREKGASQ